MAKPNEYRQCTMRKVLSPTSSVVKVSFIPAKYARKGGIVKLRLPDGSWDDRWCVEFVGAGRIEAEVPDAHDAIKKHRKATGDALPRQE